MLLIDSLSRHHWRLIAGLAAGIATALLVEAVHGPPGGSALIGWNIGAVVFLAPTLWMVFRSDAEAVRHNAARADEGQWVLLAVVLIAVTASLGATILALQDAKSVAVKSTPGGQGWLLALSATTLVTSWLMVQALFVLRYAHRYFGDSDRDGTINGGIDFPGDPPSTYRDFVYVAVCIGATCQVSDFDITSSSLRGLVTAHALIAFVFNTMVLALGINILASTMGQ